MKPLIKISYNKFLDPYFIAYIKAQEQWKDWEVPSLEEVIKRTEAFKTAWSEVGDTIIDNIYRVTGLSFTRNRIDVHIVSGNPRAYSNPIVLKSGHTKEEFISVLTEELIHNLTSDNLKVWNEKVWDKVVLKYPNEPRITQNHIIVFSIMKAIGIKPFGGLTTDYARAIELADTEIVNLFK